MKNKKSNRIEVVYKSIFNKIHSKYFDLDIFAKWYVEDLKKNPFIISVEIKGKSHETK